MEELLNFKEYVVGMLRNLHEKESKIQEQIRDYNRLLDYTEEQIRRKEQEECQLYSK